MNRALRAAKPLGIIFLAGISQTTWASSVYVSYGQSEQTVVVGEQSIDLTPAGTSLMLDFDITEQFSVSLDTSGYDDSEGLSQFANLDYDSDSFGVGLGYTLEDWSFYYQFADYEDQQRVDSSRQGTPASTTITEAQTHSVGLARFFIKDDWQFSLNAGLHYNDWDQNLRVLSGDPQQPPQSTEDQGDATFVSIGAGASYFVSLTEDRALMYGIYAGWNEVMDSGSETVSINGRNVSQIRDINTGNRISALSIAGSESYGLVNLYVSLDLSENWVADVDASFDFASDDNATSWSLSLGYFF